jgi:hypothetical protein
MNTTQQSQSQSPSRPTNLNLDEVMNSTKNIENIKEVLRKEKEEALRKEKELRERWIDDITDSAILTRKNKRFFREIWYILLDINESNTVREATGLNAILYAVLTTEYGQQLLRRFTKFTIKMETEICNQYVKEQITVESFMEWEDTWYDIFGKSCQFINNAVFPLSQ